MSILNPEEVTIENSTIDAGEGDDVVMPERTILAHIAWACAVGIAAAT